MSNGLGKKAALLSLSKIITLLISLISAMLLSRFRTLEEYGTYSEILLVINLFTALFTLGLPNSSNYFLARAESREEKKAFLSVYYSASTILCLLLGIVLLVLTPLIVSYFKNDQIYEYKFFLFLYPWAYITIGSISNILVVYEKTTKLMVFNIVSAFITIVSLVIVQILHGSFHDYMILFLIGSFILMTWVYSIVWKLEPPLYFSLNKRVLFSILKYSIPIGLASLVGTVNIEIDKLMIGYLLDTEELAIYTNASKELPLVIVSTSLTAVLLPQMVRLLKNNKFEEAILIWGNTIQLSYMIICFFVMALIVFAPQVITILYSSKYLPGMSVFRIYSLVLLLRCTYFGIVLNSVGKTKLILYSSLVTLVLNAVLNYLLYLFLGVVGPAIATFLSIGLVGFAQLIATVREVKVPFAKIFPWKKVFQITLINVIIGSVIIFLQYYFNIDASKDGIIISIIIGMFASLIYMFILYKPAKQLWVGLNNGRAENDK